jgi:acetolactate synthase-1/2/3 large subunit
MRPRVDSTSADHESQRPRVHEAIADELAELGSRAAFRLMGEDTARLITDFERVGIAYHAAHHENVAVAMADGYAWASGGLGLAVISRGPGLTNALTACANAVKGRRSVLVLSTDSSRDGGPLGFDAKLIDQKDMADSLGLAYSAPQTPADIVGALHEAHASVERGQPVLLAVPINVLAAAAADRPGHTPELGGQHRPPRHRRPRMSRRCSKRSTQARDR